MSIFAQNYRTELEIYMNQQYPSVLLEKAVGEFSKLPESDEKPLCGWYCICYGKIMPRSKLLEIPLSP